MRILITGAGSVSAIGLNKDDTVRSLREARSGVGPLKHLHTVHDNLPCGEVDLSDDEMKAVLGIPAEKPVPRTSLLGIIAVKEALEQAGVGSGLPGRIVLINGTTVGGMDITERTYPKVDTRLHDCGGCTDLISSYFGIFGEATTISTACSSAANAIIFGSELIKAGKADIVVAGGSESLTRYHLNGFNSLMILDSRRCRPFDAGRAGLNLGEGAGFVVLESEAHAGARGALALAELSGYANACDAFHQTATSPEGTGATLAMRGAISMAGLKPADIDYVNAHGTGTPNNDATESAALRQVFGDAIPPVSSTKSFTGHTTSASGGIESVICIEALRKQFLPVNLGWENPDPDCIEPYVGGSPAAPARRPLRHILCNSFGFGGNDSALVLSVPTSGENDSAVLPCQKDDGGRGPIFSGTPRPADVPSTAVGSGIAGRDPGCKIGPRPEDEPSDCRIVVRGMRYIEGADFEWKHLLNPMKARRMGTLMRRTLVASLEALQQASAGPGQKAGRIGATSSGGESGQTALIPDAVITATGLGCMENSEKFLSAMLESGETMMSPTDFMQSTHNTPGSLISIHLGDHGYNSTYSQGESSLTSALTDAFLQLKSGRIRTALVGSHDEITPNTSDYPVPDGSLALVLEAVPEQGQSGNSYVEIADIKAIAPLGARYLYDAILRLQEASSKAETVSCGPVVLRRSSGEEASGNE